MGFPYIAAGLEVGNERTVALVGMAHKDGQINISGIGESWRPRGENQLLENIKNALGDAEEYAQVAIGWVHLAISDAEACPSGIDIQPIVEPEHSAICRKIPEMLQTGLYELEKAVLSGYCAALAVTTQEQRQKGVLVLNAGDISVDFAASINGKWMAMGSVSSVVAPIENIMETIQARLGTEDIISCLGTGILTTGKASAQSSLTEAARKAFNLPCAIGHPVGFRGINIVMNRPDYAVALGLIRYAIETQPVPTEQPTSMLNKILSMFNRRKSDTLKPGNRIDIKFE